MKIGDVFEQGRLKAIHTEGEFTIGDEAVVATEDAPIAELEQEGESTLIAVDELEKGYEHVWYIPPGITSYDELDAYLNAEQQSREIEGIARAFTRLVDNIVSNEMLEQSQKIARLRELVSGFQARIDDIYMPMSTRDFQPGFIERNLQNLGLKPKQNFAIKQDGDGNWWWYGHVTNNFEDVEGEFLTETAHKEFVEFVEAEPDQMPELWIWHTPWTAHKHRASGIDWSDNMLHMWGRLEPHEAQRLSKWSNEVDLAMSHGFYVYQREAANVISQYRMVEASVLPRKHAANIYTDFQVGELNMGYSPEKRATLVKIFGEPNVATMEKQNEEKATALRESGVASKSSDEVAIEELFKGLGLLMREQTQTIIDAIGGGEEKSAEKEVMIPLSKVQAMLLNANKQQEPEKMIPASRLAEILKDYDPTNAEPVHGNTELGKSSPKEPDEAEDAKSSIDTIASWFAQEESA